MKYALLIADDETYSPSTTELDADPAMQAWGQLLEERKAEVYGARLRPSREASTVRVRKGETLVSDGPFAETKDFIGGIVVIEAANLEEAIEIAAKFPYAQWGCIEIRPVWE